MPNTFAYLVAFVMAGGASIHSGQTPSTQATTAVPDAVREHLDEASDMVDRLMRWKHIVTRPGDVEDLQLAPKSTLISIERSEARKLTDLIDAMAMQVPARDANQAPTGDVAAHLQKAREIARELMPAADAAGHHGELVTIDRTSLERLDVELDALEDLAPIVATR